MARIPEPVPALVIRYAYLWRSEAERRRREGTKYRPVVVVLAVTDQETGAKTVWAAPITHRRPDELEAAVEIPALTKRRLGLDSQRSWVVVSEVNRFLWPGPDIRSVEPDRFAYGLLPAGLFKIVRNRLTEIAAKRKLRLVPRDA